MTTRTEDLLRNNEVVETNGKTHWRIMTLDPRHIKARCEERGYSMEEIEPCIIEKIDRNNWVVDTKHPAYPATTKLQKMAQQNHLFVPAEADNQEGVGTELKKLLRLIGITASPNCSCNKRARIMNNNGIGWCKENEETILDWLQSEAKKRGLPFLRYGARKILQLAISRAEKKQAKND